MLVVDYFLNKVHDVGSWLLRIVLGHHVTLVAAAWFSWHETKHPANAAARTHSVNEATYTHTKGRNPLDELVGN